MIRLLIWLALFYIGYQLVKTVTAPAKRTGNTTERRDDEETIQDPVCKLYLARKDAIVGVLEGERHYFCSMACLEKFRDSLDHSPHTKTGGLS